MTTEDPAGRSATAPPAPAPSLLRHNRSYQALWSSEAFSGAAEQAAGVAYPFLVLATTGSAAWAGAVGSCQLLAQGLMSFWGGVLADRADRKLLLLLCGAVRAVLLGLFCVAVAHGWASMPVVFVVAMVSACCFGLSMPAGMALVKQVVRPEHITQATSQNQVRWFGAITVGPSIGGVLYGVTRVLPFLGAGVSYAVSAVLMVFVRRAPRVAQSADGRKGLLEGFRYLARDPVLRPLMTSVTLSNLAFNTTGISLAIIATGKSRGATDSFIGMTLSLAGGGAVVGALLAGAVIKRLRPPTIFAIGYWIGPAAALLLTVVPGVVPLGLVVACVYVRGPIINAVFLTYASKTVPDRLQGRVMGAIVFVSTIASPLGVLAIGSIFDAWGPVWVFLAIGAVATVAALPTMSRGIRSLTSLDELPAPPEHDTTTDVPTAAAPRAAVTRTLEQETS